MKKYLLISLLFICFSYASAQKPSFLISDRLNEENVRFRYAGADDEHYFLLRLEKESKKRSFGYLEIYNKVSMKRESTQPLELPAQDASEISLMEFKVLGDYIFVFYDYLNKSDNLTHSAVFILDKKGVPTAKGIELGITKTKMMGPFKKGYETTGTGLHLDSRNGNYIMVSFNNISNSTFRGFLTVPEGKIRILDSNLKMIEEKSITLDLTLAGISGQAIDRNGNIYLLFEGLNGNESINYQVYGYKVGKGKKYPCTVAILSADSWKVTLFHAGQSGDKEKLAVLESGLYQATDGSILLAGLYKYVKDPDHDRRGVYAAWFNQKDGTLRSEHPMEWTETDDQKKKKNILLIDYGLRLVHINKDNTIKYLLTRGWIQDYTEMRSGKFLEVKTTPTFEISMKYGMHGTKMNVDRAYAFPAEMCTDNDSYFFYNDKEKNLNQEMSDKFSHIGEGELKGSAKPCYSHFMNDGTVEGRVLITEPAVLMQPNNALQINDSELIMPVLVKNQISLMKVWAE